MKKLGRKIWFGAQGLVLAGTVSSPSDIFNPTNVSAPGTTKFTENFGSAEQIVTFIFNTIIGISAAIFMIMLLIGGVTYLTGAGNEEQTTKGKKMLLDAIIGLFIVMAAWGIGIWVLKAFGLAKP